MAGRKDRDKEAIEKEKPEGSCAENVAERDFADRGRTGFV